MPQNITGNSPPGLELGRELNKLANYSLSDDDAASAQYLPNETLYEGFALMLIAVLGIFLNVIVLMVMMINPKLRKWMSGFALHGCLLDVVKSAMCVPFAMTLLSDKQPPYCAILGTTYVVAQTAGMFNLLAMVVAEAYTFHVHNLNDTDADRGGAMMCVLFGIVMIYMGSLILHLGPTLIGGHFQFNKDIGNCLFAYGEIHNFIVQAMWIGIISLTFLIIYRYIFKFYRQLKANEQFRITVLARYMAAMSRGSANTENIFDVVYRLKRRVRVLLAMAIINMLCWYPLFFLTLSDHKYVKPRYYYRILTVIAWSHSALIPLPLLLIDRSFGVCYMLREAMKNYQASKPTSPANCRRPLLPKNQSKESSMTPTPDLQVQRKKLLVTSSYIDSKCTTHIVTPAVTITTGSSTHTRASSTSLKYTNSNGTSSSVSRGPYDLKLNGADFGSMRNEILPPPVSPAESIQTRINQSRETDLLYDYESAFNSSILHHDLIVGYPDNDSYIDGFLTNYSVL